jgi:hypothetical protein
MKILSDEFQEKIDEVEGQKPKIVIVIEWDNGIGYYSDRILLFDLVSTEARIMNMAELASQKQVGDIGKTESINIILSDIDGEIKKKMDANIVEGTIVKQYITYEAFTLPQSLLIGTYKIGGDITWSEAERTLQLSLETYSGSGQFGFEPTDQQLINIEEATQDTEWPVAFGTVLRVPAIGITPKDGVGTASITATAGFTYSGSGAIAPFAYTISGYDAPPAGLVTIAVNTSNGIRSLTGTFNANGYFYTSSHNFPQTGQPTRADFLISPEDITTYSSDTHSIKVPYSAYNIANIVVGKYIAVSIEYFSYLTSSTYGGSSGTKSVFNMSNKVTSVEVVDSGTNILIGFETPCIVIGTRYYGTYRKVVGCKWSSDYAPDAWGYPVWSNITQGTSGTQWVGTSNYIPVPSVVTTVSAGASLGSYVLGIPDANIYVANIGRGQPNGILEVAGYQGDSKNLVQIPSNLYSVNLNDTTTIPGQTCITINFNTILSIIDGKDWKDDVFVSFKSANAGGETNVANLIKWFIDNYTDLETDDTSFTAIATKVAAYPVNFVLYGIHDVLPMCEDMAWQARCNLNIDAGVVYIEYLSEAKTKEFTLDDSYYIPKTLMLTSTDTGDLVTSFHAIWRRDNSLKTNGEIIINNNVDRFGYKDKEYNFWIYNNEALVRKSAIFWAHRYSNSFRRAIVTTLFDLINREINDCGEFDLAIISTNLLRFIIEVQNIDFDNMSVTFEVEMAAKFGDVDGSYQAIEDSDYWTGGTGGPSGGDSAPSSPETYLPNYPLEMGN